MVKSGEHVMPAAFLLKTGASWRSARFCLMIFIVIDQAAGKDNLPFVVCKIP